VATVFREIERKYDAAGAAAALDAATSMTGVAGVAAAEASPLTPRSPAGDVVLAYVRQQALAISRLDPLVRRDEPDAVHQMRVATRRARSVLQAFGEIVERERACMTGWASWARAGAGRRGCRDLSGRVVRDGG
jgi:BMFP domain-containing protein YqiC